jgi:hypothetical protein
MTRATDSNLSHSLERAAVYLGVPILVVDSLSKFDKRRAAAKAEIEAAKKNLESLEAAATIFRDEIPLRYTLCRPHGLRDDSDCKPYRNYGRPIGRLEPT